jgi:cytochrome c oxidase subunit 2
MGEAKSSPLPLKAARIGTLSRVAAAGLLAVAAPATAAPLLGQPTPGGIGLQPSASPPAHAAAFFHDIVLMPIITVITLFVLGLLLYVMVRFNKRSNPVPARFTHNTTIEVVWTIAPVLILLGIAIFSYKLLFTWHDMPKADLTIKVTGYQWYWGIEYPDQAVPEVIQTMLPEDQAKAQNRPYLLAVDNPVYVPENKVVRVLITGNDVIHAFGVPAFGFVFDAIPGRVNETWFKADKPGIYYGQCRELCGVDHAFMPFEIRVVPQAQFASWVASKGGSMQGRPATAAATPAAPAGSDAAAAAPTTQPQPAVAAAAQGAGATPAPQLGASTGAGVAGAPSPAQTAPAAAGAQPAQAPAAQPAR